jgi:hypothetical protein
LGNGYQQSGLQDNAARTHQALVTERMDKGHSELIAKQQVMHLFGSTPMDIRKFRDSAAVRFEKLMTQVMERSGCQRTEAMTAIRKRYPKLMEKMNLQEV